MVSGVHFCHRSASQHRIFHDFPVSNLSPWCVLNGLNTSHIHHGARISTIVYQHLPSTYASFGANGHCNQYNRTILWLD